MRWKGTGGNIGRLEPLAFPCMYIETWLHIYMRKQDRAAVNTFPKFVTAFKDLRKACPECG